MFSSQLCHCCQENIAKQAHTHLCGDLLTHGHPSHDVICLWHVSSRFACVRRQPDRMCALVDYGLAVVVQASDRDLPGIIGNLPYKKISKSQH